MTRSAQIKTLPLLSLDSSLAVTWPEMLGTGMVTDIESLPPLGHVEASILPTRKMLLENCLQLSVLTLLTSDVPPIAALMVKDPPLLPEGIVPDAVIVVGLPFLGELL